MHNAIDHTDAVNGTIAGSWKGLDKDVGIVNWNGGLWARTANSSPTLGLKQILSGYYDSDENGDAIRQWMDNTKFVPGIDGAMYTTWETKYNAMSPWALKAWGSVKRNSHTLNLKSLSGQWYHTVVRGAAIAVIVSYELRNRFFRHEPGRLRGVSTALSASACVG